MTLLHLRIKEVEVKKDTEDITPKKRFMSYKEKRKNLSRMQRKVWVCVKLSKYHNVYIHITWKVAYNLYEILLYLGGKNLT